MSALGAACPGPKGAAGASAHIDDDRTSRPPTVRSRLTRPAQWQMCKPQALII